MAHSVGAADELPDARSLQRTPPAALTSSTGACGSCDSRPPLELRQPRASELPDVSVREPREPAAGGAPRRVRARAVRCERATARAGRQRISTGRARESSLGACVRELTSSALWVGGSQASGVPAEIPRPRASFPGACVPELCEWAAVQADCR